MSQDGTSRPGIEMVLSQANPESNQHKEFSLIHDEGELFLITNNLIFFYGGFCITLYVGLCCSVCVYTILYYFVWGLCYYICAYTIFLLCKYHLPTPNRAVNFPKKTPCLKDLLYHIPKECSSLGFDVIYLITLCGAYEALIYQGYTFEIKQTGPLVFAYISVLFQNWVTSSCSCSLTRRRLKVKKPHTLVIQISIFRIRELGTF